MAIVGRLACPWCGFDAAHVKRNEGKLPYHHCPDCGFMTPAKNGQQAKLLTGRMRPIDGAVPEPPIAAEPIIVPGGAKAAAAPVASAPAAAAPAAPKKPAGFWDQLAGKVDA